MLSCGAALHHCVVALAGLGWKATVHRLPDPSDADYLAAINVTRYSPTDADVALAAAIRRRRTDRRHYSDREVSPADIALMGAHAARGGVTLRRIESPTDLNILMQQAVSYHVSDSDYLTELNRWGGRRASLSCISPGSARVSDRAVPVRRFADPALLQPSDTTGSPDRSIVVALGTRDDDTLARLRAGEATSLVLLAATTLHMATCPITEPLESAHTRASVRDEFFDDGEFPQMLIRVGWPPDDAQPLPLTPRRQPPG